ncbi:methylated-DNA--[protein]-cysteine S-methyltransferase [Filobacillus milosensis]|uniref:Methylated-DNA--protein-cysteine methyltransferase n=1 Tax=Filobacillus milosensis TaxID=94137 RepID=A0A4Y8IBB6_9BACI|nr:methylated-DNA--[protein]-cysteine S-methyltransferase [Filobacillus milosensis]TFB13166.1 methylated-DNA--[protein]-cysteine S-methyltransferase [Filobacillus milosensis]
MKPLTLTSYDSPMGEFLIGGHNEHVYFVKLGEVDDRHSWLEKWRNKHSVDEPLHDLEAFPDVKQEFDRYFNDGLTNFTFKTEMIGTDFQKRVWQVLNEIPYGEQWTYKDIAEAINHPKAIRAVGGAINKNPISIAVPCHRVIGSDGSLTGYASGLNHKKFLLHHETKSSNWLHQTS